MGLIKRLLRGRNGAEDERPEAGKPLTPRPAPARMSEEPPKASTPTGVEQPSAARSGITPQPPKVAAEFRVAPESASALQRRRADALRRSEPAATIGQRVVIRPAVSAEGASARLDPARVTIIAPRDAWRLGMRLVPPARLTVPSSAVKALPKPRGEKKAARGRESRSSPASTAVSLTAAANGGVVAGRRAQPLSARDELLADYMALHAGVETKALSEELKLPEIEVAASLNNLLDHGLVVRSKDGLKPAPDLRPEGLPSIFNSYLAPILERLRDESDRSAWGEFIALVAHGWKGRWHATKSALTWKRGRRAVLKLQFAKTQVRLSLEGVVAASLPPAVAEAAGVVGVEAKHDSRGRARCEIVGKGAIAAESLARLVRSAMARERTDPPAPED